LPGLVLSRPKGRRRLRRNSFWSYQIVCKTNLALDLGFALVFIEVQLQIKVAMKIFVGAMKPRVRVLAGELQTVSRRKLAD